MLAQFNLPVYSNCAEVIWTRQAIQMVNEFVDYIAQYDYATVEQWALELMGQTDKLADYPSPRIQCRDVEGTDRW